MLFGEIGGWGWGDWRPEGNGWGGVGGRGWWLEAREVKPVSKEAVTHITGWSLYTPT